MKQAALVEEMEEVEDVPVSAIPKVQRQSRYGSVEGLNDEELADPEELERQAMAEQWGPVLMLPAQNEHSEIQPAVDESGGVDFGAFGTVDFERSLPEFDKAKYKAEKLKEQLKDLLIIASIVKERLPGRAKYLVTKYLRMGVIELEHIENPDMLALAKLWLRARKLQADIGQLEQASHQRRRKQAAAWLEATA
jgi:hypothetical protein